MGAERFSPSEPGAPEARQAASRRWMLRDRARLLLTIACLAVLAAAGIAAVALSAQHQGAHPMLRPASHVGAGPTLVPPPPPNSGVDVRAAGQPGGG
ncbi:MAG: hypothetical protein ACYDB7_12985 [Mycobacteriales bacterium]